MQKAIPKWTIRLVVMVLRIEGIETEPAELIFALRALHKLAPASSLDANVARRTSL